MTHPVPLICPNCGELLPEPVVSLTPTQGRVFGALVEYIAANDGVGPTLRELAAILGTTKAAVHYHLVGIEERGWIRRTRGSARAVRILHTVGPGRLDKVA